MLAVIITCLGTCAAQSPPPPAIEYNESAWKELSSAEGRFSILLPGTPQARVDENQTSVGKVAMHVWALRTGTASYYVMYLDFPTYSDDDSFVKKALDSGRDGMLAKDKEWELLAEDQISLGGFSGREFVITDHVGFGVFRAYVVKGRLYEIGLFAPYRVAFSNARLSLKRQDQTSLYQSINKRFFDSFDLSDAPEGEVDRLMRELREKKQGVVVTMVGSADPPPRNPITGGVINGKAVRLVTPAYPAIARSAHASGQVSVQVVIDLEGNVAAAQVVDGHPLLRAAAIKAARESKFTPTKLEGKPVMVVGVIKYNFVAQ